MPWSYRRSAYLILNKPANYECSHKPKFYPSIYALLPRPLVTRGVQAVGRLDEDTTGLLLLSDDGQFIHLYLAKKKIPGYIDVLVKHPFDKTQVVALLSGVQLNDEPAPIARGGLRNSGGTAGQTDRHRRKISPRQTNDRGAGNRVEGLNRAYPSAACFFRKICRSGSGPGWRRLIWNDYHVNSNCWGVLPDTIPGRMLPRCKSHPGETMQTILIIVHAPAYGGERMLRITAPCDGNRRAGN